MVIFYLYISVVTMVAGINFFLFFHERDTTEEAENAVGRIRESRAAPHIAEPTTPSVA